MTDTAKRLKITFIDNICEPEKPGRSGHSDIIWEVSRCLLEAGHTVTIVADYTTASRPFQHPNLRVVTFKARAFDRRNGLGKIFHVLRAFRLTRVEPADLLFTTDAFSAGVTSLCSRRTPVVFLTPANIYQRQASGYKLDPIADFFYRLVSYFAARRSAHIIATSRDLKGWWEKTGAAPERVSVIPLGIEAHQFGSTRDRRRAAGPLRLLYVARFEGDNNPQLLVALAQQLKARDVPFTLTAVGDGTLLGRVKADAAKAGLQDVLHFDGYRDYSALPALYAANDAFVFVREAGGPPRVVLQAMASGLAVVAFNSSGLEDYVASGETGFLVQNGSVAQVAATVASLSDDRELLYNVQTAAQRAIRQNFSWQSVTASYLALFLPLLTPTPRDSTQPQPERKTSHG